MSDTVFHVRINGGPEQELPSKTGIYQAAVAAIPAVLGVEIPCDVEIWSPGLLPEYGPYFYRIRFDDCVRFVIDHLIVKQ